MTSNETKHFLVTGCRSGIGHAITSLLLSQGHHVTGLSRNPPNFTHSNFNFIQIDLSDLKLIRSELRSIPNINGLVHAAGFLRTGNLEHYRLLDGQNMMNLHILAVAALCQTLNKRIKKNGRIILIGSRAAGGSPGRSLYAASKAGLKGLSRSFAAEFSERGITVNVIAPGATLTPMLKDPRRGKSKPIKPPFGRFIEPEEVAYLAEFLLSDSAACITGQQIGIYGGASI